MTSDNNFEAAAIEVYDELRKTALKEGVADIPHWITHCAAHFRANSKTDEATLMLYLGALAHAIVLPTAANNEPTRQL